MYTTASVACDWAEGMMQKPLANVWAGAVQCGADKLGRYKIDHNHAFVYQNFKNYIPNERSLKDAAADVKQFKIDQIVKELVRSKDETSKTRWKNQHFFLFPTRFMYNFKSVISTQIELEGWDWS